MVTSKTVLKLAKQMDYTNIAKISVSQIAFESTLRDMCAMNTCGKYGTSWVCPPACGSFDELKQKVLKYTEGLLVQKVYTLEDSFDFEGMMAGQDDFSKRFYWIVDKLNGVSKDGWFALGAGTCNLCKTCPYPDAPCIQPQRARPSVEACGINVSALCSACNVPYINGKNTVSYVSLFLF